MRGLLITTLLLAACGGDSAKTYDTYQACFDDLIKSKPKTETIVECCIDKEIGGMKGPLCGDAEPDCINYLTTNLKQTDADITAKQEACTAYVAEKAMQ